MRSVALVLLAACSFDASGDPPGPPGDQPDARLPGPVDAQALTDTPPLPCTDVDGDSVCDDVDPWLCDDGHVPTSPDDDTVIGDPTQDGVHAKQVSLGGTPYRMVAPGASVTLNGVFDWAVACPGGFAFGGGGSQCQAQIELGVVGTAMVAYQGCLANRQLTDQQMDPDRPGMLTFTAPTAPGSYEIRIQTARHNNGCTGDWNNGAPAQDHTIAKVCVH